MKHRSPRGAQMEMGASSRRERGFTMIEVLVVAIVLGLLSGIAVPKYLENRQKARISAAAADARNLGAMIEDSWAKDRVYPDELAENAGNILGARLSEHNKVAHYARNTDGMGFELCVVYLEGTTVKAYALYDSNSGGLTDKGTGSGPGSSCAANTSAAVTPITTDTGTSGGGTGGGVPEGGGGVPEGGGGGGGSSLAVPADLTAATVDGQASATLNWQSVADADGYALYLDGNTTPAWTGTATTADLPGIPIGYHEVTVAATKGTDKSSTSNPAVFTIYGNNDFLVNAHPAVLRTGAIAGGTWLSGDYDSNPATVEAGETDAYRYQSRWWTFTAPRDMTVEVITVAASDGSTLMTHPQILVWKSTATDPAMLGTTFASTNGSTIPRVSFLAKTGETFKVRQGSGSSSASYRSKFRLSVSIGPANDMLADAAPVTGLAAEAEWYSPNVNNKYAGNEPSEPNTKHLGMWWTVIAPRTSNLTLEVVQASDGSTLFTNPHIEVWNTTTTDVATLGTTFATTGTGTTPILRISVVQGGTYKIRVASLSATSSGYNSPYRLRITPGPLNDALENASSVGALSPGVPWVSADVSNVHAGLESGDDPTHGNGSMWWTFTATHSGTYRIDVLQASDGSTRYTYPKIYVWRTTATTVGALGAATASNAGGGGLNAFMSMAVTAGDTYKVRASTANSWAANYRTKFRVQITP